MAKTIAASFDTIDLGEYALIGSEITFDAAPTDSQGLNKFLNRVCSTRAKVHATRSWSDASTLTHPFLTTTSGSYVVRNEYLITPRRHVKYLTVWCNGAAQVAGTGLVKVAVMENDETTEFSSKEFTFTGTWNVNNEQTTSAGDLVLRQPTAPDTVGVKQLIQVSTKVGTATNFDLRMLTIKDEVIVLADMP